MTTALRFSEDDSDPKAEMWQDSAAASPFPKPAEDSGPHGYFEYLQTVQKEGHHGEAFGYKTVNTDVLGWVVSRVRGRAVTEFLSERIGFQIDAEQDAYFTMECGSPGPGASRAFGFGRWVLERPQVFFLRCR